MPTIYDSSQTPGPGVNSDWRFEFYKVTNTNTYEYITAFDFEADLQPDTSFSNVFAFSEGSELNLGDQIAVTATQTSFSDYTSEFSPTTASIVDNDGPKIIDVRLDKRAVGAWASEVDPKNWTA